MQKGGGWVQIACKIVYVLNGRPLTPIVVVVYTNGGLGRALAPICLTKRWLVGGKGEGRGGGGKPSVANGIARHSQESVLKLLDQKM